uniref:Uncharacterized protein n=1 Tax=Caenorhabditis japonica TaxID=281687 RepID=A0A8R1I6E2_CAEJA
MSSYPPLKTHRRPRPPLVNPRTRTRTPSPTPSKRSVSPIVAAKAREMHNEETEALYRRFRRQETLALM